MQGILCLGQKRAEWPAGVPKDLAGLLLIDARNNN